MERKVIVITGPTGSGKTALSLMLAEKINTEIISADSRQVFKYLNIGTAKPDNCILQKTKHHFIDYVLPDQNFDAKQFETEALGVINALHNENKIPVVAGGTGLYVKALIDGMFDSADSDDLIRQKLKNKIQEEGIEALYEELKTSDPVSASKMLPQNYKRVMRALEVLYLTGKPIWRHHSEYEHNSDLEFFQFALNWPREILYDKINARVDDMIGKGLVTEVQNILNMGYDKNCNSLNTVGYKEIMDYIDGRISLDSAVELIKRNSRRYAKRQLTWFRKDSRIKWFDISSSAELAAVSAEILAIIR